MSSRIKLNENMTKTQLAKLGYKRVRPNCPLFLDPETGEKVSKSELIRRENTRLLSAKIAADAARWQKRQKRVVSKYDC